MGINHEDRIRKAFEGRYEILEQIGEGGMAMVYKAVQLNLRRIVALKIINPSLSNDPELIVRFHREAQMLASLNHPNIITIYDEGEVAGVHFLSMEFLEGMSMDKIIANKGRLDPEFALECLLPIAYALELIHQKGLIHRDVKCANIFITRQSRPVLMDFGIAHSSSMRTLSLDGTILGTPAYMSPEQADGKKTDHRSDIYSFGVVLFESLVGRVPLNARTPMAILHKIIYEAPPSLLSVDSGLPEWIDELTTWLLQKDPAHRPQNFSQVIGVIQNGGFHQEPKQFNKPKLILYGFISVFVGLIIMLTFHLSNLSYSSIKPVKKNNFKSSEKNLPTSEEDKRTEMDSNKYYDGWDETLSDTLELDFTNRESVSENITQEETNRKIHK
ncbi:MAG: serine/threonine-protein kinase [Bacteroidales bacterium]|nr:serine/threonine-protein kinase [Bacteroidales bacterium]